MAHLGLDQALKFVYLLVELSHRRQGDEKCVYGATYVMDCPRGFPFGLGELLLELFHFRLHGYQI